MNNYIQNAEAENQYILQKCKDIARSINPKTRKHLWNLYFKAFRLAVNAHKDMRRKSGEPYIYHPISVAEIVLKEVGLGATSAIAALLHDVVEDTDYTYQDIHDMFGEKIANIVEGVTKIEKISSESVSQQAENFKKIMVSMADDPRVMLIKLADRLHNMRTLGSLPEEKKLKIASETAFFFVPIAHRLGLYRIKSELEDLSMKYHNPFVYNQIAVQLKETKEEREALIEKFVQPIREQLEKEGIKVHISSRTKSIYSIYQKMERKKIDFKDVYDIFAVRIVFKSAPENEENTCRYITSIVTRMYPERHDRTRDFLTNPKPNGYQSLHVTVMSRMGRWVEVQVRSKRMDEIAEQGFAAHFKYKDEKRNPEEYENRMEDWLLSIREIIKSEDSDALELLDEIKMNLQLKEVFFFTPKGDRKVLPNGATVLDFAYLLHNDIGNSCIGAKVNYDIVAPNHVIKNGEQVEIITSKKQAPKVEWLDIAKTPHARTRIKNALRKAQREDALNGRTKLRAIFNNLNINYSSRNINKVQSALNYTSSIEFFSAIAQDKIESKKIEEVLLSNDEYKEFRSNITADIDPSSLNKLIDEQLEKKPDIFLLDDKSDAINYKIANCCKAIPGDQVVGFQISKDTIMVHKTECKVAIEQMSKFGNKIVKAKWRKEQQVAFLCGIKIRGFDRQGLVKEVLEIISSKMELNIRSIDISSVGDLFSGKIILYIHNTNTLRELIESLEKIKNIEKAERILPDNH